MWIWILIGVAIVIGLWWSARANELFFVSVRDGRVLLVRGRVPQALLNDLHAAVQKPPVHRGSIRAIRTSNGAQLYARGMDEFVEQRLRNIFRMYPQAQLRSAKRINDRTVGQLLGIAWLAWLFDRSRL